jgi:transcriptional regulator with XRE-family HTH domain
MANPSMGSRIGQARTAQGMSLRQLATRVGVKPATVENWERGRSEPRANKLLMLAGILNVPVLRLLDNENESADTSVGSEGAGDLQRVHQKLERAMALQAELSALLSEATIELATLQERESLEKRRAA